MNCLGELLFGAFLAVLGIVGFLIGALVARVFYEEKGNEND